mmetsp:Transcript_3526/g.5950  ORF Transcript_3526/g.5950 Transcript_3526/m.5950 type:complete len:119 (+) Transcript_3526:185-541(+)
MGKSFNFSSVTCLRVKGKKGSKRGTTTTSAAEARQAAADHRVYQKPTRASKEAMITQLRQCQRSNVIHSVILCPSKKTRQHWNTHDVTPTRFNQPKNAVIILNWQKNTPSMLQAPNDC